MPANQGVKSGCSSKPCAVRLAVPTGSSSTSKTNVWGIARPIADVRLARLNMFSKGSISRKKASHLQRAVTSTAQATPTPRPSIEERLHLVREELDGLKRLR